MNKKAIIRKEGERKDTIKKERKDRKRKRQEKTHPK